MNRHVLAMKALAIDRILADMYGEKKQGRLRDPTEELILTVLSQNTNDTNRDRAYLSLRERYPRWGDIARARPSSIATSINIGGLGNIKSRRIKKILRQIAERAPDYSLSFLKKMSDGEVWDYLISFDGVGPKTASCVLIFSLGRAVMPVDTHVHRVSRRLGMIPQDLTAHDAHDYYRKLQLPVDVYQLHLNMIQHGRTLCRPQKPKCVKCLLKRHCRYDGKSAR